MVFRYVTLCILILGLSGCLAEKEVFSGYIDSDNTKLANAGVGRVVKMYVARGDSVKKDQILCQLDSTLQYQEVARSEASYQAALSTLKDYVAGTNIHEIAQAEAELRSVKSQLDLANKQVQRLNKLKNNQFASDTVWDEAVSKEAVLQANLEQISEKIKFLQSPIREDVVLKLQSSVEAARAVYRQASWKLSQQTLSADTDATVVDVYFKEGEFVNSGQSLISVRRLGKLEVIFYLPFEYLTSVAIGKNVYLDSKESAKNSTKATISYVADEPEFTPPMVYGGEFNSKYVYMVRAVVQGKSSLHPGQAVDVRLSNERS